MRRTLCALLLFALLLTLAGCKSMGNKQTSTSNKPPEVTTWELQRTTR